MRKPVNIRHRKYIYKALAFIFCLPFSSSFFIKNYEKIRQKKKSLAISNKALSVIFLKDFYSLFVFFR